MNSDADIVNHWNQNNMVILYVDDDPEDLEIFCDAIKVVDPDINCITMMGGRHAIRVLQSMDSNQLPSYIFLDNNMPGISGIDILKEIRKISRLKKSKIVIFSTAINPRDEEEFRKLGADHFIKKASLFKDLCQSLDTVLRHE